VVTIGKDRLIQLLNGMNGRRIAVVGDLMLDRYIWGSVSRISPEAPVPVIDMEQEQDRLGGAANVAKNVKSLGGEPVLVGVIGADNSGRRLHEILRETKFSTDGVVVDGERPTTVKTRVIAHSQHVVRIDREMKTDISFIIQNKILDCLRRDIDSIDGVIIEDYNKGVVVKGLIRQIIDLARQAKKPILIDPKYNNFFEYQNVTLFKPNRKEVEEALGIRLKDGDSVARAGKSLMEQLHADNVLLTLGEHGMTLFEKDGTVSSIPTMARNVADVSGAGDTVIATLAMALAAGAGMREAATLANFAGGIVCGSVGIVPIEKPELGRYVSDHFNHD
jgi:rfaE bifunctional protein kinase chain/domain